MNVLHLAPDEKFINFVHRVFASLPGITNRHLVEAEAGQALKHVVGVDIWRQIDTTYRFSPRMAADLDWADCLIVHYLTDTGVALLLSLPPRAVAVWSGWGGDYYPLLRGGMTSLFGNETAAIVAQLQRSTSDTASRVRSVLWALVKRVAIGRVDFFSAPIESDYYLLKASLGAGFKARFAQLNYGSLEQTLLPGTNRPLGDEILVGNSATPSNNHIEVFRVLARIDLGQRKVLVPLSYGDDGYRAVILARGRELLGGAFEPILAFLPLAEYNHLISRCATVIMNHKRQQALGNILSMLYRGARVFLDQEAPVYRFLIDRGARVDPIQALARPGFDLFERPSVADVARNRSAVTALCGHQTVLANARRFVERVAHARRNAEQTR